MIEEAKDYIYLVDKDLLYYEGVSANALGVLVGIGFNCFSRKEIFISYAMLEYTMFGHEEATRSQRESIISGFQELVEREIITVIRKTRDNGFLCDVSKLYSYDQHIHYSSVTFDEYQKILQLDENVPNFKLLKYFVELMGTLNASRSIDSKFRFKIGDRDTRCIASLSGISRTTLFKYNEILKKHHLLYITQRKARVNKKVESGELYNQATNAYSRYKDRKECEEYLLATGNIKKERQYVNYTNSMRSFAQQYNSFVKHYKDYPCEDMEKVNRAYEAAISWNEYAKEVYESKLEIGLSVPEPQYKDLSIFDQYDLSGFNSEN